MFSIRLTDKDGKETFYTNFWFIFGCICFAINVLCSLGIIERRYDGLTDGILLNMLIVLMFCAAYLQRMSERMP